MRLIDADAMRNDWLENGQNEYVYDTNAFLQSIDEQPTIEAEPVRHARYIPDMNYRTLGNCGLCGGDVTCIQNYCPNCGAKMDGGDPK